MKFSLTLFLTIALSMSPLAGFSPGCSSCFAWICNRDKEPVLPEEQHPVETRTSNWPCWFGLSTCPIRPGNGNQKMVLPEEQLPIDTQHRAFNWRCWLGLSTCHITTEDGDQKIAFYEQQLPINAQRPAYNWPRQLGPSARPRWICYRASKVVTPKDPVQQSPGPKQKVFSLHDTVGHLWDNLDQGWVTWILMDFVKDICIQSLWSIARRLWRRVRRLWGQVSY